MSIGSWREDTEQAKAVSDGQTAFITTGVRLNRLDPAEKVRVAVAAFPDGNVGQVFFDQYGNIQASVPR